eukprot:4434784-Heterocapsa_arctica.AAC.1
MSPISCWRQLVVASLRWPGQDRSRQVLDVLGVLHPVCSEALDHCLSHRRAIVDIVAEPTGPQLEGPAGETACELLRLRERGCGVQ